MITHQMRPLSLTARTAVLSILSILLCFHPPHVHADAASLTSSLSGTKGGERTVDVYILNTGDIHEHSKYLPRISSYIKYLRGKHRNVIALDAGDAISDYAKDDPNNGDLYRLGTRGNAISRIMEAIGYDACTIGNHDVCHGIAQLSKLITRWHLSVGGVNLERTPTALPVRDPRVIQLDKVSIGLIGTISTHRWHLKGADKDTFNVAGVRSKKVTDVINSLRGKADIIVLITHELDADDRESADTLRGIKLIVGGHSHTTRYEYNKKAGVAIMKAGWKGRYISQLKLTWDWDKKSIVAGTRELIDMEHQQYEDETVKRLIRAPLVKKNDYDGDGRSELAVYQQSTGSWRSVALDGTFDVSWTVNGADPECVPVMGDFDGDGKSDPAVYLESIGRWTMLLSARSYEKTERILGGAGYLPAPGDYDSDLITDPAAYEAATGRLIIQCSDSGYAERTVMLGGPGCVTLPGYYDGDAAVDPCVYRESSGDWTILLSDNNYSPVSITLGNTGCVAVHGYYDRDQREEPAVYQESTGRLGGLLSADNYGRTSIIIGGPGCTPAPGDYDGDGKDDPAVYDEASGSWTVMPSGSHYDKTSLTLGGPGWVPVTEHTN